MLTPRLGLGWLTQASVLAATCPAGSAAPQPSPNPPLGCQGLRRWPGAPPSGSSSAFSGLLLQLGVTLGNSLKFNFVPRCPRGDHPGAVLSPGKQNGRWPPPAKQQRGRSQRGVGGQRWVWGGTAGLPLPAAGRFLRENGRPGPAGEPQPSNSSLRRDFFPLPSQITAGGSCGGGGFGRDVSGLAHTARGLFPPCRGFITSPWSSTWGARCRTP